MIYVVNCTAAIDVCHEPGSGGDATNISRAVREINRVAADSPEESAGATIMTFSRPSGTPIMTMSPLGGGPAGGEGGGVGLAIISPADTLRTHSAALTGKTEGFKD